MKLLWRRLGVLAKFRERMLAIYKGWRLRKRILKSPKGMVQVGEIRILVARERKSV
jgi:hypothetical protein